MINNTLDFLKSLIEMHKVEVKRDFRRIPPAIQADPLEVEQLFSNLFVNAIDEMHNGGTLKVFLDHDNKNIQINISDTGKGIPLENLDKIFDPFFTTKKIGTGLGLSVVFRIIKTYNGNIKVSNEHGKGALFCVSLPLSDSNPL